MIGHIARISTVVLMILNIISAYSMETQSFQIGFTESQVLLSTSEDGWVSITGNDFFAGGNSNEPNLPIRMKNFVMPSNSRYISCEIESVKTTLIGEDVSVVANIMPIPTDGDVSEERNSRDSYPNKCYPSTQISYQGAIDVEGCRIMQFAVCPFIYDSASKMLSLITDMNLKVTYDCEGVEMDTRNFERGNLQLMEIVQNIVSNKESLIFPSSFSEYSVWSHLTDYVEYAIITNAKLQSSLDKFAKWKTAKGVKSKVYTIEYIDSIYNTSDDLQLKIKKYIYYLYKNRGLKYVMLAGDDSIVPVRYCLGKVGSYRDDNIPSDMYYSCFNGDFSWDKNGNGIFAEVSDNVDFNASVFLTRLPVSTSKEVLEFTQKLIDYETRPLTNPWNMSMLFSGAKFQGYMSNGCSDSYAKAFNLYKTYILPNWRIAPVILYDKTPSLQYPPLKPITIELNSTNLLNELEQGHIFVDVITHGIQTSWSLGKESFSAYNVSNINNVGHSIITTSACHTSAFDSQISGFKSPICLGEAFINSYNSGAVAYIGSSRYGWMNSGDDIEYSPRLNGLFYEYVFNPDSSTKELGAAIDYAKKKILNLPDFFKAYRWLLLSVNGFGDSQMPIYTVTPSILPSPSIKNFDGNLTIDANIEDCNICVMSYNDWGKSFYFSSEMKSYISITNVDFKGLATVCFTKHGYIPRIYKIEIGSEYYDKLGKVNYSELFPYTDEFFDRKSSLLKRQYLKYNPEKRIVMISLDNTVNIKNLRVVITDAYGIILLDKEIASAETQQEFSIPAELCGVINVSLQENATILDTQSLVLN